MAVRLVHLYRGGTISQNNNQDRGKCSYYLGQKVYA